LKVFTNGSQNTHKENVMATTFTLTKATPYSLAYTITGDGAAGTRTAPQLIADCVPGPLKRVFTKLNTGGGLFQRLNLDAAGNLLDTKGLVRIRHVEGIAGAQAPATIRTVVWGAAALNITASNLSVEQIEIRLAHSVER
jgi:hypothetical protein